MAAAAAAGTRPIPTLGDIGSLAWLWTLYDEGDPENNFEALRVRERGGATWRQGYSNQWREVRFFASAISERAATLGLGKLAAAQRMDAEEWGVQGKAASLSAFLYELRYVKAHGPAGSGARPPGQGPPPLGQGGAPGVPRAPQGAGLNSCPVQQNSNTLSCKERFGMPLACL